MVGNYSEIAMDPALLAMWTDYFGSVWIKVLYSLSVVICTGPGIYVLAFVLWYGWDAR